MVKQKNLDVGLEIEKTIIQRFQKEKPEIIVKAPSRINLIAPLDAVEADYWSPAMATYSLENPLAAYCYIKSIQSQHSIINKYTFSSTGKKFTVTLEKSGNFTINKLKKNQENGSKIDEDIVLGSLSYIIKVIPDIGKKLSQKKIEIGIISTIPKQSGIGGSSSIIIAILWAIGLFTDCASDPQLGFNRDSIAEFSTDIENTVLKNTAGYGDRYTIARGGIGFTSYVGKLKHQPFGSDPLAVYDRIDKTYNIEEIPIVLAFSGIEHKSGDIHSVLRKRYLSGDKILLALYKELSEISWKSRFSFMKHNWEELGEYFRRNNEIVEKIMTHCGFEFGIGWANKILIDLIKDDPDVFSVKLTGAGGGGSVFALVKPSSVKEIIEKWQSKLNRLKKNVDSITKKYPNLSINEINQLNHSKFYQIRIQKDGVHSLT